MSMELSIMCTSWSKTKSPSGLTGQFKEEGGKRSLVREATSIGCLDTHPLKMNKEKNAKKMTFTITDVFYLGTF